MTAKVAVALLEPLVAATICDPTEDDEGTINVAAKPPFALEVNEEGVVVIMVPL